METPDTNMSPEEEALWAMSDEDFNKYRAEQANVEQPSDEDNSEDTQDISADETVEDVPSDNEDNTEATVDTDENTGDDNDTASKDSTITNEKPTSTAETDLESDEDQTSDDDETKASEQSIDTDEASKFKALRVNGEDIPINNIEELYALASQGGAFTQKMQQIAPYRKAVDAMKTNGLTDADIALLIDAKSGDKTALAKLIGDANVDVLDIEEDTASQYVPKVYGATEAEQQLADIQQAISQDEEFNTTSNIVDRQWDDASRTALKEDPNMILGLHNDVKTGMYAKVAPEAAKLAVLDGYRKSSLDYYIEAGQRVVAIERAEKQRVTEEPKQVISNNTAIKRKVASAPKGSSTNKKSEPIDYMAMSDDDFRKMREDIMSRN